MMWMVPTRFSSHSSLNWQNFCAMRSWALPTAVRIFPRTEKSRQGSLHDSSMLRLSLVNKAKRKLWRHSLGKTAHTTCSLPPGRVLETLDYRVQARGQLGQAHVYCSGFSGELEFSAAAPCSPQGETNSVPFMVQTSVICIFPSVVVGLWSLRSRSAGWLFQFGFKHKIRNSSLAGRNLLITLTIFPEFSPLCSLTSELARE